jgi:hypothetical protein
MGDLTLDVTKPGQPELHHTERKHPMLKLFITLQATVLAVIASMEDRIVKNRRDERGSVTIEQVIWAGAVILIVGIVVAAIRAFVTSEAGKIK